MLFLCRNRIGDDGLTTIARSKLPKLEFLAVTYNGIGAEGAIALASSPLVNTLKMIMLSGNQIQDKGVAAFAL